MSDFLSGRIGRIVARNALENPEINIVAINEYAISPTPNLLLTDSISSSPFIDLSYMVCYFDVFLCHPAELW